MSKRAMKALRTFDESEQSLIKEEIILSDNEQRFKAVLVLTGEIISIRRRPASWLGGLGFSESLLMQRGYSSYNVDGEMEESALGPLKHVVFIVHGIG